MKLFNEFLNEKENPMTKLLIIELSSPNSKFHNLAVEVKKNNGNKFDGKTIEDIKNELGFKDDKVVNWHIMTNVSKIKTI